MKIVRSKEYDNSIKISELEPGEVFTFCGNHNEFYMRMVDTEIDGAINTVNLSTGASALANENAFVKRVDYQLTVANNK